MKKFLVLMAVCSAVGVSTNASDLGSRGGLIESIYGSPSDFAAPVVYDKTLLTQAGAGTIVFDESSGAFFGLTSGGSPATAGSWRQLGSSTSSGTVSSQGTSERIERALITNSGSAAISSQSGSWLASVSRTALGTVTLTFQTSPAQWSAAPTCVCQVYGTGNAVRLCSVNSATTSGASLQFFDGANVGKDVDFNVICQGPH